jgi:hypothetical protein
MQRNESESAWRTKAATWELITFPIFFDYLNLNTSYLVGDAYEACAPE